MGCPSTAIGFSARPSRTGMSLRSPTLHSVSSPTEMPPEPLGIGTISVVKRFASTGPPPAVSRTRAIAAITTAAAAAAPSSSRRESAIRTPGSFGVEASPAVRVSADVSVSSDAAIAGARANGRRSPSGTAARRAAASSAPEPKRSSGSLAIARAITSLSASVAGCRRSPSCGGGSLVCAHMTPESVSRTYGARPVSAV